MPVDINAIRKASEGDQSKKVTVSKAWLREIYIELSKVQKTSGKKHEWYDDLMKELRK